MELLGWSSFKLKVMLLPDSMLHTQPGQRCTLLGCKGWGVEKAKSLFPGISRADNINDFNMVMGN